MIQHTRRNIALSQPAESPLNAATPDVGVELRSMQTIAEALAILPDTAARARVLRWATERYLVAPPPAPPVRATPCEVVPFRLAAVPPADGESDLAGEAFWDQADDDLSDLAVADLQQLFAPTELQLIAPTERPAPTPVVIQPDEGVASIVHGFVKEFQQLARAWQTE